MTRDTEIAVALRIERRARGLTIEHVAKRIGVAVSTVSRWELLEDSPTAFNLEAWCNVLGFRLTIEPTAELAAYQG